MTKVRIFADSISDIPQEWMTKYHIGIVPLYIVFEGQSYLDRIEMDTHEMYRRVKESGKLPKTAAPSPADFVQTFGPVIENGEDVLFISMSSQLSSTYQNALIAAREFPPGRVTFCIKQVFGFD
ncbi:DegV family protein [Paenibacillus sp. FSL K6-1318]|uniref:DegV family protein n=1 Tax=Paenibacillus sp. FSL K6-1318 TaxID=2975291 RepID=UPI0030EE5B67